MVIRGDLRPDKARASRARHAREYHSKVDDGSAAQAPQWRGEDEGQVELVPGWAVCSRSPSTAVWLFFRKSRSDGFRPTKRSRRSAPVELGRRRERGGTCCLTPPCIEQHLNGTGLRRFFLPLPVRRLRSTASGLSGISCGVGQDGSKGARPCRDAKSLVFLMPSSISCWPAPIPNGP
jgi:hypothetical protein